MFINSRGYFQDESHQFSDEEIKKYLNLLPKKTRKDSESSAHFIQQANKILLDYEGYIKNTPQTTIKDYRDNLESLKLLINNLVTNIDSCPVQLKADIAAVSDGIFHANEPPYQNFCLLNGFKEIGVDLKRISPLRSGIFTGLLILISDSLNEIEINKEVKTNKDNSSLINLTCGLMNAYWHAFKKEPGITKGSNFRNFIDALGEGIGENTLKESRKIVNENRIKSK